MIIHILPWYSPANIGGTELYIISICKELQKKFVDTLILCPSNNSFEERFFVSGIPVIASPFIISNAEGNIDLGISPPPFLDGFKNLLKENNADIVHFHCLWPKHIYYLHAAQEFGAKTLVTPHLAGFSCLKGDLIYRNRSLCNGEVQIDKCTTCLLGIKTENNPFFLGFLKMFAMLLYDLKINVGTSNKAVRALSIPWLVEAQKKFLKKTEDYADQIIIISKWYKDVLLLNQIQKYTVIETQRKPIINKVSNTNNLIPLKIIFAGRQSKEKGLDILLDSLEYLPKNKIELHIFGHNSPTENFNIQINTLQKKEYNIQQHDSIENKDLLSKMNEMDILCFPSSVAEMAPMTIKEAFSVGLPVIGSDIGGIRDAIIDGENGFVFKWKDSIDLSKKIAILVNDRELLLKMKNNLKRISSQSHIDQYLKIYSNAI